VAGGAEFKVPCSKFKVEFATTSVNFELRSCRLSPVA